MTAYRAAVARTALVTPRMLRVTVAGPELRDHAGSGLPDESCRVLFPAVGGDPGGGTGDEPGEGPTRNYTIRRRDTALGEIDLDFVLHEGGVAATWAAAARPGDPVVLSGSPAGKYSPAPDAPWEFIAGDATALPAIGRIVEGLPAGRRATVVCVVDDEGERQDLRGAGEVDLRWVYADPAQAGPELTRVVRGFAHPPGPGYLWVAGEAAATRDVRRHLRHELGLPAERYDTIGYWRHDAERWEARYRQVADRIDPRIAAADAIADDEAYFDTVDDIYAEVGL